MGFFDTDDGVRQYLEMVDGYDGRPLIRQLSERAAKGATVLELGMGGGLDLDLLVEAGFDATGSDMSEAFLRHYAKRGGTAPTLQLDAKTIATDEKFDVIFTNKVLQHLTRDEMLESLARQGEVVAKDGLLFHTLWTGTGEEVHHGVNFTYYDRAAIEAVLPATLRLAEYEVYEEMKPDDSCLVVLRPTARTSGSS